MGICRRHTNSEKCFPKSQHFKCLLVNIFWLLHLLHKCPMLPKTVIIVARLALNLEWTGHACHAWCTHKRRLSCNMVPKYYHSKAVISLAPQHIRTYALEQLRTVFLRWHLMFPSQFFCDFFHAQIRRCADVQICRCFLLWPYHSFNYFRICVNSLTPICLLAGTKNYPSVGFLRRNSMFFLFRQHNHNPQTTPPW